MGIKKRFVTTFAFFVLTFGWSHQVYATSRHATRQLLTAIQQDNYAHASYWLKHHADPNTKDTTGWTALMIAAHRRQSALCKLLLASGAKLNLQNADGETALSLAVTPPSIREEADPRETHTFIHLVNIHPEEAERLHHKLLSARADNWASVVQLLLQAGADPNIKTKEGRAPLAIASEWNGLLSVMLVNHKADIHVLGHRKRSILANAAGGLNDELVRIVLAHGATGEEKNQALWAACADRATDFRFLPRQSTAVIRTLLEAGADPNAPFKPNDDHPLLVLVCQYWVDHAAVTSLLLDHGAVLESKDAEGYTALLRAAEAGDRDCVRVLIERGANVNAAVKTQDSVVTALKLATLNNHPEIAELLKQAGTKE